MASLDVLETGIVYRNPQPHLRSRHAYFPTLAELPSGELFAAFDMGSAFEAVDVRSYCCRSADGGRTWDQPTQIFAPEASRPPTSTTCRVAQVAPGQLLAWGCQFDRTVADEGLANPQTNGFCRTDFVTLRSGDGGRSWSSPQAATLPVNWSAFETCAPPFAVTGQRLLALTSAWPDWSGQPSPWRQDGLAFISDDGGHSWRDVVTVFANGDSAVAAYEQCLTRLSDERLLAVCWSYDVSRGRSLSNRIAFSEDGRRFTAPQETPLQGETCRVLGLTEGHVLAVYRRVDLPGLWAQIARIDGEQWVPCADQVLWAGQAYSAAVSGEVSLSRMSGLRFGCPTLVRLADDTTLIAFWCVEDCVSVIRTIRVKVNL